jgi:CheY-like chemotaxis protein
VTAASPRATTLPRRRIMVVDDDRDIRESLRRLLEEEGFDVQTCPDGLRALEALRAAGGDRPDLVILDLMMPVMDGWQFRVRQRADPGLADIPVLAISAGVRAKAAGVAANAYLEKPFRAEAFLREVTRVLRAA